MFFRHNCFFFGSEFFKDNTAIDRSRIVNLFYWLRARALALHNSFWLSASDRLFSFFKARGLRLIWPGHLQNMTRLPHPNLNAGKTTAIARLTTRFDFINPQIINGFIKSTPGICSNKLQFLLCLLY